jgi:putative hydrolase of the HAD superfamily
MVKAVLFDLDDTLFDHDACARDALEAVQACHPSLGAIAFPSLERTHAQFLEQLHEDVVFGRMALDDARRERFRRLFDAAGVQAGSDLVERAAVAYRERYLAARRAISGAATLLPLIKARARVGIVSNNLLEEQKDKLRCCGLDRLIDALIVSEEAGVSKPDPAIFEMALDRLGCTADEAVMIGDSWSADVVGARAAGIRAIWFNRHGAVPPDSERTRQIAALEPPGIVLKMIFDDADVR